MSDTEHHDQRAGRARRDEEDAAAVIAILTALAAASCSPPERSTARSVWADPAHRLGLRSASATGWWASGLPRGLPR